MTNEVEFLRELAALTRKYGIAIGGCGCCDSPYLEVAQKTGLGPESGYAYLKNIEWVASGDSISQDYYKGRVIT